MIFKNTIPILYCTNLVRSLDYYTEVLGFHERWDWGTPPAFGGVSRDSVSLFFCENGQGHPGTWITIGIDDVDEYFEFIKAKGAKILSPPQTFEWNMREMLVEDLDGHRIRFGQYEPASERKKTEEQLPSSVQIVSRSPTVQEYRVLTNSVGWGESGDNAQAEKMLAAPVFAVVAEDTVSKQAIGCGLILGDSASFYYIKDVIVHSDWQCKKVGTAIMQALSDWLNKNAHDNSMVGLYTGERLSSFYNQFGFSPVFGMQRRIHRDKEK